MFKNQKQEKHIDLDQRKNPLMTMRTLKYYCQREGLFSTPQLNDKLYLQYKGFTKIIPETISNYRNIVSLWLNNNAIQKISGLHSCINLTSIYLNNNFIEKMEGFSDLQNLEILNLSHNKIEFVQGLVGLRKLHTLNLAKNFLIKKSCIEGLIECQNLGTLDMSENELQNTEEVFDEIVENRNLACLYLKATPMARGLKNYRKKFISKLQKLKFLDNRPVLQEDHRLSEAWLKGGIQFEKQQKIKMAEERKKKQEVINSSKLLKTQEGSKKEAKQKAEGFIASVTETEVKIANIENKEEEQRIINKYFSHQKEQIAKNKEIAQQRIKEKDERNSRMDFYKEHETKAITKKVNEILGKDKTQEQQEIQQQKIKKRIYEKWNPKYQKLLEALLLKSKFDFEDVQPSFNMIMADINKKMMKPIVRFQIEQLRKVWTDIQIRKRNHLQVVQSQN